MTMGQGWFRLQSRVRDRLTAPGSPASGTPVAERSPGGASWSGEGRAACLTIFLSFTCFLLWFWFGEGLLSEKKITAGRQGPCG